MKEPNVRYSMKGDGVDCSKLGAINAQSAVSKTDTCNTRAQAERFDPSQSHLSLISGSGCWRVNSLEDDLTSWKPGNVWKERHRRERLASGYNYSLKQRLKSLAPVASHTSTYIRRHLKSLWSDSTSWQIFDFIHVETALNLWYSWAYWLLSCSL